MADHHEITYTSKWDGQVHTKIHTGTLNDARGWTESIAKENGNKAVCESVTRNGERTHIVSEGDSQKGGA